MLGIPDHIAICTTDNWIYRIFIYEEGEEYWTRLELSHGEYLDCGKWPSMADAEEFGRMAAFDRGAKDNPYRRTAAADPIEPSVVKIRDLIKMVEAHGWRHEATKGSHRQYKHPSKPGRITVPGHPRDEVAPGTSQSILNKRR